MTIKAVYPNGIVPWSNRVDRLNTVYAVDPNTLAAEVVAIQSTIGTNPQIESSTPVGTKVVYATVNARIHDVQMGNQLPAITVTAPTFSVKNDGVLHTNSYPNTSFDPMSLANGIDFTVKAPGWYRVWAKQRYFWAASGFVMVKLTVGSNVVDEDFWSWDFSENKPGGNWHNQPKMLSVMYEGVIQRGQRVSVTSVNSSNLTLLQVDQAVLKLSWVRSVPSNVTG